MPSKSTALGATVLGVQTGSNIKHATAQLGMNQGQLAETLDIENVTSSRIETGVQLPSLDRLQQIAQALQLPLQALVVDESDRAALVETISATPNNLREPELAFVCDFVLSDARHWRLGQQS